MTTATYPRHNLEPYISNKMLRQLMQACMIGARLRLHPYTYNKESGRMEMVAGSSIWFWYLNAAFAFLYYGFLLGRLLQVVWDENASLTTLVTAQFVVASGTFPVCFQLNFIYTGEELCKFTNNSIGFFQKFSPFARNTYWKSGEKLREVKFAEMILDLVLYWFMLLVVLFGFLSLLAPATPVFLSSLREEDDYWNVVLRPVSVFVVVYFNWLHVTGSYVIIHTGAVITFGLLPALSHMEVADNETRLFEEEIQWYRQMELIVGFFNRCFGWTLLPAAQCILISLSVYGVFAGVKLSGILRMTIVSVGMLSYLLLFLVYRILGEYYKRSGDLIVKWGRMNDNGWKKRILRTIRPIRVKILENFIDIPIVLTLTDTVIGNSINVLLM